MLMFGLHVLHIRAHLNIVQHNNIIRKACLLSLKYKRYYKDYYVIKGKRGGVKTMNKCSNKTPGSQRDSLQLIYHR